MAHNRLYTNQGEGPNWVIRDRVEPTAGQATGAVPRSGSFQSMSGLMPSFPPKLSPTARRPRAASCAMRTDAPVPHGDLSTARSVEDGVAGIGSGSFRLVAPHHVAGARNPRVLGTHGIRRVLRGARGRVD